MATSLKQVTVRNPIVLEKIADATESGAGRNFTEAAENLILRGFDAMSERDRDATAPGSTVGEKRKSASSAA